MTRVQVRILAGNQAELRRAATALAKIGGQLTVPNHPGRRGDWLAYGHLDVEPEPGERTRRRACVREQADLERLPSGREAGALARGADAAESLAPSPGTTGRPEKS